MDNITATSSSPEANPNTGNPLNPQSAAAVPTLDCESEVILTEFNAPNSSEPVLTAIEENDQTNIDGNVQAHVDVKYEAHDVALTSVKTNGHQQNNGFTAYEHKMNIEEINDDDGHPEKSKSCCSMLNILFLTLAIVCFTLFLTSIGYMIKFDIVSPLKISIVC